MTWILLLALGLAFQDGKPPVEVVETETVTMETRMLDIPDEIAPAIMPYVACLLAARGEPIRSGRDGPEMIPEGIVLGSDCKFHRDQAARNGDRLMARASDMSRRERRTFVESALIDVDRFVDSLPQTKAQRESGVNAQD